MSLSPTLQERIALFTGRYFWSPEWVQYWQSRKKPSAGATSTGLLQLSKQVQHDNYNSKQTNQHSPSFERFFTVLLMEKVSQKCVLNQVDRSTN